MVIDLKSGKEFPIQAKLDSWAGVREYSKLVTVVDTLDETTNGEQRKYMSKIISEVKACYNSRGNQAQQEDVDAEFEKIISGLSINN